MKKFILIWLGLSLPLLGALGDNAPSLPTSYVLAHPRLTVPTNAELQALCLAAGGVSSVDDGCTLPARFRTAANAYSGVSNTPGTAYDTRYLLLSYYATKWGAANGHGPANAPYLAKIKGFTNWIPDGNHSSFNQSIGLTLAEDWFYSDLCILDGGVVTNNVCTASATLTTFHANADTLLTTQEGQIFGDSPMNDVLYITDSSTWWLPLVLAMYDPGDSATAPTFVVHLRIVMDMTFNVILPVHKKLAGAYDFCPNASTDASIFCGAGWPDNWNDYTNRQGGIFYWTIHAMLAWASATNQMGLVGGVPQFFNDNGWIKNFAYWTMYQVRPDFVLEPIGMISRPEMNSEYNSNATPTGGTGSPQFAMLDALAAIYNDPTIRGWSRVINWSPNNATIQVQDGFEPTAWPYYHPDNVGLPTNSRSVLAQCKNFDGHGELYCNTGFGESDTFFSFRWGDNFWTHPYQGAGAFSLFNRGPLAINSGSYRAGALSYNNLIYTGSSISKNTTGVCDPADRYPDESYPVCSAFDIACAGTTGSADVNLIAPNDCGQKRVGSTYGNAVLPNNQQALSGSLGAPPDLAKWLRGREWYHNGTLTAFACNAGKYCYFSADITYAYNNFYSMNAHTGVGIQNQANEVNRTSRVINNDRSGLWIPRGTAAYVIMLDQISTVSGAFTKNWYLHSINQPTIPNPSFPGYANSYVVARTELITSTYPAQAAGWPKPWGGLLTQCNGACTGTSTQYQYNGKLYGFNSWPTGGSITTLGGPTHEFSIIDATTGIETNYNECRYGQCGSEFGSVAGSVAGPWTITLGVNDTIAVNTEAGVVVNLVLTAGVGRTCAQVVTNLNTLLAGAAIAATASCEGQTAPLSYLAIRSNSNVKTGCPTQGATCSQVTLGASNALATFGFSAGPYCGGNYIGAGTTCVSAPSAPGFDEGYEAVGGVFPFIHPNTNKGPQQPGGWRIIGWTGGGGTNAGNVTDQFLNVMLATSASDTNVISTAPVTTQVTLTNSNSPSGAPALQTIWKDNADTCTYTVTLYLDGQGGTATAIGAGCVNVIN